MPGPIVGRVVLGQRLEAHRNARNLSALDAARAIGDRTDIRVRHYEAGRRVPKYETVALLGQRYGLTEEQVADLQAMREVAAARNHWARYQLPETASTYMGMEEDAIELRTVEHVTVPGILQTEAYTRRKLELGGLAPVDVGKRVTARLQRQKRLATDDESPLALFAVISEAALRRCAAEAEVGWLQLEHLKSLGQRPNVEVRVLPLDIGLHAGMDGGFSVLHFEEGVLQDIAYVENVMGGHLNDEAPTVAALEMLFGKLRSQALDPNDSLDWIIQLAEQTRKTQRGSRI